MAAARTAQAEGRPLRVVADEIGTPTHVPDLSSAIIRLMEGAPAGMHHVVNSGVCSRAAWARAVLGDVGIDVALEEVTLAEFPGHRRRPAGVSSHHGRARRSAATVGSGHGRARCRAARSRGVTGEGSIPGVTFAKLTRHPDSRGSFAEAWRAGGGASTEPFAGVQANLSSSAAGVLRGLHLHRRQSDLWIVLSGVAFVALVDVRPMVEDEAAGPRIETATLERDETVVIPPLVAHGFLALEPLELLYVVTNEYDGSDELGFAWDDPLVNVSWPRHLLADGEPVVSERDRANVSLTQLVEVVRTA